MREVVWLLVLVFDLSARGGGYRVRSDHGCVGSLASAVAGPRSE